jgi:hypothetical protein
MLGIILLVVLILVLFGGTVPWGPYPGNPSAPGANPYWHGYGFGPVVPGGLGFILIIVLILVLLGRF